jgi:hypothetical protein
MITSQTPYPIVTRRKHEIAMKLEEADLVTEDVWNNTESIIARIEEIARRAIEQAKLLGGKKLLLVRSVRTELERKDSELDAMMKSLQMHRQHSGPLAFLQAFHRQNLMATALQELTKKDNEQESSDLPLELTVRGDLQVHGRLRVDSEVPSPSRPLTRANEKEEEEEIAEEPPLLYPKSPTSPMKRAAGNKVEFTSLAALAAKRRQRTGTLSFDPFKESKILDTPDIRLMIYFACPFRGKPLTRLLFSSELDGRSIQKMHDRIDNVGITIVFVRRGMYTFGGFAAMKWKRDGLPFGQSSGSFLFSVSRDAHVPLRPEGALMATEETLTFGQGDLVLAENFDKCSSEIEHGFGVGFPEGSEDARCFLAGKPEFKPEVVEVWGFFTYDE